MPRAARSGCCLEGAGVQSTTVALMSVTGEQPSLDHAIFADTHWEPAAVYEHLDWLTGVLEAAGVKVHRVAAMLASRLVLVKGKLQREGIVTHVIAHKIVDLSHRLDALALGTAGDDTNRAHPGYAPADAVKHPHRPDPRDLANARRHPRDRQIRIGSRDFH